MLLDNSDIRLIFKICNGYLFCAHPTGCSCVCACVCVIRVCVIHVCVCARACVIRVCACYTCVCMCVLYMCVWVCARVCVIRVCYTCVCGCVRAVQVLAAGTHGLAREQLTPLAVALAPPWSPAFVPLHTRLRHPGLACERLPVSWVPPGQSQKLQRPLKPWDPASWSVQLCLELCP